MPQPFIPARERKLAELGQLNDIDTRSSAADNATADAMTRRMMEIYGMQHQDQMMPGELQHQALANDAMRAQTQMMPGELEHQNLSNAALRMQNQGTELSMPFTAKDLARRDALGDLNVQHSTAAESAFPGQLADEATERQQKLASGDLDASWAPTMKGLNYGKEAAQTRLLQTQASHMSGLMDSERAKNAASVAHDIWQPGTVPSYAQSAMFDTNPLGAMKTGMDKETAAIDKAKRHDTIIPFITDPVGSAQNPTLVKQLLAVAPDIAPGLLQHARDKAASNAKGIDDNAWQTRFSNPQPPKDPNNPLGVVSGDW